MKPFKFTLLSFSLVSAFFICLCFLSSCNWSSEPEEEIGPVFDFLWTKPIIDVQLNRANGNDCFSYKDYFIANMKLNDHDRLLCLNKEDGTTQWVSEAISNKEPYIIRNSYTENNIIFFMSRFNQYAINLEDGQMLWENQTENGFNSYHRMGPHLFLIGEDDSKPDSIVHSLFTSHVEKPHLQHLLTPNYSYQYQRTSFHISFYGYISNTASTIDENGDTLLAIAYTNPLAETDIDFYGLFNKTQNNWVYENIPIHKDSRFESVLGNNAIKIVEDKVYHQGMNIVCNDLKTGEELWIKEPLNSRYFNNLLFIKEHHLIISNIGATMFCFDAETGSTQWETNIGITGRSFRYQDGVIYFVNGNLMAIDVIDGTILWNFSPPLLNPDANTDSFQNSLTGIPAKNGEKGKIFVISNLDNGFCYEAVN